MSAAGIGVIDIPGYRVLGALGQGGMASVYLAVQENFGREVALKLVSTRYRDDESFAARFMREAKIVAQMRHSNIVSVYDVGNHHGQLFLSMELLEGDLKSRIGDGINETEAARICIAIASALNYAHEKGFLHRDIKPENVLFRSDGTPVLTDFGIARALQSTESMTQSGMLVGTPSYMSPEQARGESVDQRTDIYALGVLFYELLTGSVPYKATSAVSTALKHISDPIPVLPEPLKHWNPFLQTILAKNANERFQSCTDVIGALAMVANITEVEDFQRTAIINAAEMAAMLGAKPKRVQGKDQALSRQTNIGSEPASRSRLSVPLLSLLLIGAGVTAYRFDEVQKHVVAPLTRHVKSLVGGYDPAAFGPALLKQNDGSARDAGKSVARDVAGNTTSAPSAPAPAPAPSQDAAPAPEATEISPAAGVADTAPSTSVEPQAALPEVAVPAVETHADAQNQAVDAARVEPKPDASVEPKPEQIAAPATAPAPARADTVPTEVPRVAKRAAKPFVPDYAESTGAAYVPIERVAPRQLARFKEAFEGKDMNALRAVAVISPANQRLAQTLFTHYNGIRLQLAGVVSVPATNEMRARFVIEELRNPQGQVVEPGEHWKTLPVTARINAVGTVLLFW
jgi:serine/threonine protein kinase